MQWETRVVRRTRTRARSKKPRRTQQGRRRNGTSKRKRDTSDPSGVRGPQALRAHGSTWELKARMRHGRRSHASWPPFSAGCWTNQGCDIQCPRSRPDNPWRSPSAPDSATITSPQRLARVAWTSELCRQARSLTSGDPCRRSASRYLASSYGVRSCQQRKRIRIHLKASDRRAAWWLLPRPRC